MYERKEKKITDLQTYFISMIETLYELLQIFIFWSCVPVTHFSSAAFSGIITYQKQSRFNKNLDKSKCVILTVHYHVNNSLSKKLFKTATILSHEERNAQTQARNPACTCYASDLFHTLLRSV
jgi:hypothetical protein